MSNGFNTAAILLVKFYRYFISPYMGSHCRFEPSCSRYALEAYQTLSFPQASLLTAKRLCKCHPFGGHGYDPLPLRENIKCH